MQKRTDISKPFIHVAIALGLLLSLAAASCSNTAVSLQHNGQSYSGKDTSGTKTIGRVTVGVSVRRLSTGAWYAKFTTRNATLSQATLFFTNGTAESKNLNGSSGYIQSRSTAPLWYIRLKLGSGDYWYFDKNGDYWYFDRSGSWKPPTTRSTSSTTGSEETASEGEFFLSAVIEDGVDYLSLTVAADGAQLAATLPLDYAVVYSGEAVLSQQELTGTMAPIDFSAATDVTSLTVVTEDGRSWEFDGSLWGWETTVNGRQNGRGSGKQR